MHLTMRFIGEVDGVTFSEVGAALEDLSFAPFRLALRDFGCFCSGRVPRVVWVGVDDGGMLARLHEKIESRLRRIGLPPENRKFKPHLTLARLKATPLGKVTAFLGAHALFGSQTFTVDRFELYSSQLGAAGAIHRVEAIYPLDNSRRRGRP